MCPGRDAFGSPGRRRPPFGHKSEKPRSGRGPAIFLLVAGPFRVRRPDDNPGPEGLPGAGRGSNLRPRPVKRMRKRSVADANARAPPAPVIGIGRRPDHNAGRADDDARSRGDIARAISGAMSIGSAMPTCAASTGRQRYPRGRIGQRRERHRKRGAGPTQHRKRGGQKHISHGNSTFQFGCNGGKRSPERRPSRFNALEGVRVPSRLT